MLEHFVTITALSVNGHGNKVLGGKICLVVLVFLIQMYARRLGCPTSPSSLRGSAANVTLPSRLLSSCEELIGTRTRLMIGQAYIKQKK